jgi:multiple sugar transport system permease protein
MIAGSLSDAQGVLVYPPRFFPSEPDILNYKLMLSQPVLLWLKNTLILLSTGMFLCLCVTFTAGYAFSIYKKYLLIRLTYYFVLVTMMIPRYSLLISLSVIIKTIGLKNTLFGALLPDIYSPLLIFLTKNYIDTIPVSLIEIGRLEGATEFQILRKVILPLSKPVFGVIMILQSLTLITNYIWQKIVLTSADKYTYVVGIITTMMKRGQDYGADLSPIGLQLASGVLLFIPMLIIFIIFQKQFTEGLTAGAVKE